MVSTIVAAQGPDQGNGFLGLPVPRIESSVMTSQVDRELAGELAAFLRARRERAEPLPGRARPRRTPGLRREEVAELAGVSVDYVVRLEQGRGLHPSPEVLDALARTLQLSADERRYLFDLARQRLPEQPAGEELGTARLVRDLSPLPALVQDQRFDIQAWNPEMAAMMPGLAAAAPEGRNAIDLCLSPAMTSYYEDWDDIVRQGIADLRAAWAASPDDTVLAEKIARWRATSPDFARLWELRDVRVNARGTKRIVHPVAGRMTIAYEVLNPLGGRTERLVIYRAADAASQAALDGLTRGLRAAG
jgi:transcriptional regulator with XRE-family HTH domain